MDQVKQKMAALKTTLDELEIQCAHKTKTLESISSARERLDEEINRLTYRAKELDDDFTTKSITLKETLATLHEMERQSDEIERENKSLKLRNFSDNKRLEDLEKLLQKRQTNLENLESSNDEITKKLIKLEAALEIASSRADASELKLKEMEKDLGDSSLTFRSLQLSDTNAKGRDKKNADKIRQLATQVELFETRAVNAEMEALEKAKRTERLTDELEEWKLKREKLREEMDATLKDLESL